MKSPLPSTPVDFDDIQGLLRFGYGHHKQACYLLLRISDRPAARAWLAAVRVGNAVAVERAPDTTLQLALSFDGLLALGVADDIASAFSADFIEGPAGAASRLRRLGDIGANAPRHWRWSSGPHGAHLLVMLYALPGRLAAFQQAIEAQCAAGFEIVARLPTVDLDGIEPFGFVDGISQPQLDWQRVRVARDQTRPHYDNLACLGEFVLGYPNEYGGYTERPLLDPQRDPSALLPRAEELPGQADLGRNGSYLVLRQLAQDVDGFDAFLDRQAAGGDAGLRQRLAEAMVGRTMGGEPLADRAPGAADGEIEAFDYRADPQGLRCPLGAHVRRANPRNGDMPPGPPGIVSWLGRTLGLDAAARERDRVASTRFHRLLRRGREYADVAAAEAQPGATELGLHFICLNANIARQFEFVQAAWLASTHFDGLGGESDPLLGNRLPAANGQASDYFSLPQAAGADQRLSAIPRFVTVRGSGYFFLPGIRALRFLASAA